MDAVCVGEAMVVMVPDPPAPPATAETYRLEVGGAESNVAVHLTRAGFEVAWHSALGDDGFGARVLERISAVGVACRVRTHPARPTGLYVKEFGPGGTVARYYRRGSAASTLGPADAEEVRRTGARLVHTTGITPVLSDSCRLLVEELMRLPDTIRSFDVNYRPALHGPDAGDLLRPFADAADVTFVGLDEAGALWGAGSVDEVRGLLPGPEILVVKQGADGATAFRGDRSWFQPAPKVTVVEPVGAGDAFAGGFLSGLLKGEPINTCLARGARLAGEVLQVDGDLPV